MMVLPAAFGLLLTAGQAANAGGSDPGAAHQASQEGNAGAKVVASQDLRAARPDAGRTCWPELGARKNRTKPSFVLKNLRIRDDLPKSAFATGESHVEIIELPAFSKAYRLEFRLSFTFKGLMIPSAAVLDEDFCLIKDYPVLSFNQEYGAFLGQWEERAYVPVSAARERYVLAYVNGQLLDKPAYVSFNGMAGKPMQRFESGYAMLRINK